MTSADRGAWNTAYDLYALCGELFPARLLAPAERGANSRRRVFPPEVTFWAFVAQVLAPGTSCRGLARKVEAWWRWAEGSARTVTASAYCQARSRLEPNTLELIGTHLAWSLERHVGRAERWLGGRAVQIVDGTNRTLADTAANQGAWPQSPSQAPGLGFPLMKSSSASFRFPAVRSWRGPAGAGARTRVGCFWKSSPPGWRAATCSWPTGASAPTCCWGPTLQPRRGCRRAPARRPARRPGLPVRGSRWPAAGSRRQAGGVAPPRPDQGGLAQRAGPGRPARDAHRGVWCAWRWPARGFCTRRAVVATTLLDPGVYPAAEIAALDRRCWAVEGHFAPIKTTLGLDVLRAKSPEIVEKEIAVHAIAYNLVRALMQQAAHAHGVPLERLSCAGSRAALEHWAAPIHAAGQPRRQAGLVDGLLAVLAGPDNRVRPRPDHSEPRVKKRRAKNYQLLTRPRHRLGNQAHRNQPAKRSTKTAFS